MNRYLEAQRDMRVIDDPRESKWLTTEARQWQIRRFKKSFGINHEQAEKYYEIL